MKQYKFLFFLVLLPFLAFAQLDKYKIETHKSGGYTYETVTNDPLKARIYTLENGLKVYMTVYKNEPRIQTYIAVRAGSKNDPPSTTGLAHYLEHMLFKGTSKIGTINWPAEKIQLDKIESLFEEYRNTVSDLKRKELYHSIDSISQVAAQYAVANEYDKMLANLGATGTNAYTFVEQTVYVNDIPSNALEKWAEIEGERFSMFVPRLFHTELEAVYEEKNRGLDNDGRKLWEKLLADLFPGHPYGTQTTIGTIEDLKNPSITEIKKYFAKYYVPDNMAICLSGDFDPDQAIKVIDKGFSKLQPKEVKPFKVPEEEKPTQVKEDTVWGPDAENVAIGFRFRGNENLGVQKEKDGSLVLSNSDPYALELLSMLLNNGQAGLLDLDLNQKQKLLSSSAYNLNLNDYSMLVLSGTPKKGQSLEQVRDLLLKQIDRIKKGDFPDWLLEAVKNDYKSSLMKGYESNRTRANAFVDAFISHTPWNIYSMEEAILDAFKKEDLVKFANNYLKDNYVVIYKKTGKDTTIKKVEKPSITPVHLNRDTNSVFYGKVMASAVKKIAPKFVDYSKDFQKGTLKGEVPVLYKQNKENSLFNLYYIWDIGRKQDPKYSIAAGYIDYLGTDKYNPEELREEFYKLGASFNVSASDEMIVFSLSGLNENFDKSYKLFEEVLQNAKPDKEALDAYVGRILKAREDAKKSKSIILRGALASYAKYGAKNPFTNIVSKAALEKLTGEELTGLIKNLSDFEHRILYYGPQSLKGVEAMAAKYHTIPPQLKKVEEAANYTFKNTDKDKVYFVDYDMVQAEIIFLSKSDIYNKELVPTSTLFNAYFGGGMGSLVFQEMRESRALAYSVKSYYAEASKKDEPNYVYSYIGTQADKIHEAIEEMEKLMDKMPKSQLLFNTAKADVLKNIRTQRITKSGILWSYERAKKLGLTIDIRKEIFEKVQKMDYQNVKDFQEKYFQDKPKTILIIGSKKRIDLDSLKKYGEVQELSLKEIFGY